MKPKELFKCKWCGMDGLHWENKVHIPVDSSGAPHRCEAFLIQHPNFEPRWPKKTKK